MSIEIELSDPAWLRAQTYTKDSIALLPEKMLECALEVLMDQAHLIVGLAQINAPVDTGSYRDSIRVERGGEGLMWREVKVRAGGYITNPRTGRLVDYAHILEGKYRVLGSAVDEVRPTIGEMIKAKVVEECSEP